MTDRLNDTGVFGGLKERQSQERETAERRKLAGALTSLVSRYPWTLIGTLTTSSEFHPEALDDAVRGYLGEHLERQYGRRWWWFYAIEIGSAGRWHAHVLLGGLDTRHADSVRNAWKLGLARVEPFAQGRNGAAYVVKQVAHGDTLYSFAEKIGARINAWRQREQHRNKRPHKSA